MEAVGGAEACLWAVLVAEMAAAAMAAGEMVTPGGATYTWRSTRQLGNCSVRSEARA